jgi:hypothetical protein
MSLLPKLTEAQKAAQAARLSLVVSVITGIPLLTPQEIASDEAGDVADQVYRVAPAAPVDGVALDFSFSGAVGGR